MDLFTDTYQEIKQPLEGIFKEKGSKFISKIYPVKTEQEIKEILDKLRGEYYDARHHCYAWILGSDKSAYRTNDDGEPSGSAGKPIYGQLVSADITNVLAVVIRYFGGTKLGIPGLINAYRESIKDALMKAEIIELTVNEEFTIKYDYPLMDLVMRTLRDHEASIVETNFEMDCKLKFAIRKSRAEKIVENFNTIFGVNFEKSEKL